MQKYLLILLIGVLATSCNIKNTPVSPGLTPQIIPEKNTPVIVIPQSQSGDLIKSTTETIQKKQEQIGIKLQSITDPEFKKLKQDQIDIYQGKEIWTQEVKKINIEFTDMITHMILSNTGESTQTGRTEKLEEISNRKNTMMKEFFATKAYTDYIVSKEEALKKINIQLNTFIDKKDSN